MFAIDRPPPGQQESRLRLQTIVRLRWFAVAGQLLTIATVYWWLGFALPLGPCLALIAVSAWLNVYLRLRYPARHRLDTNLASALLAYDIAQLGSLLYLTGGLQNPFVFLIVAPVTVSAATLPPPNTVLLGLLAAATTLALGMWHLPLPWSPPETFSMPSIYRVGVGASVIAGMVFLALYAARLSKEARQMSAALAATEHVLAREQRLHALDGLAAAAAHELGTPLATIVLVAKELERDKARHSDIADDIGLLRSQADRCRDILRTLTRSPTDRDPHHASLPLSQLLQEASAPFMTLGPSIRIRAEALGSSSGPGLREPVTERQPGVIYGLKNLIENAVDFSGSRVEIAGQWSEREVIVTVTDDGPGFSAEVMDALGDPYVTTRHAGKGVRDGKEASGLGLGFFIAKSLLERSGALLGFENRQAPERGAIVRITWPRSAFEAAPAADPATTSAARA